MIDKNSTAGQNITQYVEPYPESTYVATTIYHLYWLNAHKEVVLNCLRAIARSARNEFAGDFECVDQMLWDKLWAALDSLDSMK